MKNEELFDPLSRAPGVFFCGISWPWCQWDVVLFNLFSLICSPAAGLNIARDVHSITFVHQYVLNISSWKLSPGAYSSVRGAVNTVLQVDTEMQPLPLSRNFILFPSCHSVLFYFQRSPPWEPRSSLTVGLKITRRIIQQGTLCFP